MFELLLAGMIYTATPVCTQVLDATDVIAAESMKIAGFTIPDATGWSVVVGDTRMAQLVIKEQQHEFQRWLLILDKYELVAKTQDQLQMIQNLRTEFLAPWRRKEDANQ